MDLLCTLWSVLSELESTLGVAPQNGFGFIPVTCEYVNHPTDASLLCELWCKIQLYDNKTCITEETTTLSACPAEYLGDPEESLLCELSNKLTDLETEAMPSEGMPSQLETITLPPSVDCIYTENPTSAVQLCELWCQIVVFEGSECSTEVACPAQYQGDPEESTLCQLWMELEMLLNEEGMPSQTIFTIESVECLYLGNPTTEQDLCDLWCDIQTFKGKECVPETTTMIQTTTEKPCPQDFSSDPEEQLLCSLWKELITLQEESLDQNGMPSQISTSGSPTPVECLYSDNPTSSEPLCNIWCQIQIFKGSECSIETTTQLTTTTTQPVLHLM